MRQAIWAWICPCIVTICHSAIAEPAPYHAQVAIDKAPVHSGPGLVHYASQHLAAGTSVEVWRNDPGGWCAVRPPVGSHSWVKRDHIEKTADPAVGQIVVDDARAWVGTTDDSVSEYMWQVKLRRGELVEILGSRQGVAADGSNEDWCKISPPAGEFRWIQNKNLKPIAAETIIAKDTPKNASTAWNNRNEKNKSFAPQPLDNISPSAAPLKPDSNVNQQLINLNIELSRAIAVEPRLWDFTDLRKKTIAAIGQATTDLDRGQAIVLLSRIDEFQKLKDNLDSNTNIATSPIAPITAALDRPPRTPRPSSPRLNGLDPRYDGHGWLVPVIVRGEDRPSYALVDEVGNIKQYVTPAPGFNLHRYLRQEIGVYGQRGYIENIGQQHVTAQRVVVMERHR